MKKEVNKFIIVIGFFVAILGVILSPIIDFFPLNISFDFLSCGLIILFGATFIFAKNNIVKNFGYGICAISFVQSLPYIISGKFTGLIIYGIGAALMFIGALLYVLVLIVKYCGFVKGREESLATTNVLGVLNKYKDLKTENILTEEEFNEIKSKILASANNQSQDIDDLKKWKKAVAQQVITEEEYTTIKNSILSK